MKCRNAQKKLSAYQDRELKSKEEERIASHLLSCQSCREQYAELERVWQTLRGLGEIYPDPWFYRQLVRKIKEPRQEGWLPALQHVFQLFRVPVTVSVILAVGLLVGTYLGSILARRDLFPFQTNPAGYSQEALFSSMRVFDPAPPGTFAEGYLRMVTGAFPASPAL
jgi:predicted anti-sigma-YlaC factor YlaD